MDVLLARPPRRDLRDGGLPVPPLGLAYIASALREAGHQVELLDALALGWTWEQYRQHLSVRRPEILGLSAMTPVADLAARAARIARPHVGRIVLGGPHPTALGDEVFEQMPELDAAVEGEGEVSAPELLAWWERGGQGEPPAGVRVPGRPFRAARVPEILENLPRPAWDLLPMGAYRYLFATRPRFATMVSSRGCPFRCTFCDKSVGGSRWRARSSEDVVDEMAVLVRDWKVGFINFYDDNFLLKRGRVVDICEEILRRKIDVEWKCEGRVDSVDPELLELMRRAGCRVVAYGVESANPETLALLRKDITVGQAERAFAATRQAGLRSLAYVILGSPGEDAAQVRRTVDFCRRIDADYVQFSTLAAYPGTALFAGAMPGVDLRSTRDVPGPVDSDHRRQVVTDLSEEEREVCLERVHAHFSIRQGLQLQRGGYIERDKGPELDTPFGDS
ncbi:MAG: radical SAM protein, partial [Myxococcota bacterium]|nr:radical SAM protein [Myxococcota bacterium]